MKKTALASGFFPANRNPSAKLDVARSGGDFDLRAASPHRPLQLVMAESTLHGYRKIGMDGSRTCVCVEVEPGSGREGHAHVT